MRSISNVVGFAFAILTFAACSNDTCEKCAACWTCAFYPEDNGPYESIKPAADLSFSQDDVLARLEGDWTGPGVALHVARKEGDAVLQSVATQTADCEVPKSAAETCAGMRVPIAISGTLRDGMFTSTSVTVAGTVLGDSGESLSADNLRGLPFAGGHVVDAGGAEKSDVVLVFATDGLWLQTGSDRKFTKVAERE